MLDTVASALPFVYALTGSVGTSIYLWSLKLFMRRHFR